MKRIKIKVYGQYDIGLLEGHMDEIVIPYDIDEVALKARLRDMGYILAHEYFNTAVYLCKGKDDLMRICTGECRTLEELGIEENSLIVITKNLKKAKIPYYD